MSEKSAKKYTLLVWALLECSLFSGIVYGWGWLAKILTSDGYFVDLCNDTASNINTNSIVRKLPVYPDVLARDQYRAVSNVTEHAQKDRFPYVTKLEGAFTIAYSPLHDGTNGFMQTAKLNRKTTPTVHVNTPESSRKFSIALTFTKNPQPHMAPRFGNVTTCRKQSDRFLMLISLAHLCKSAAVMLVGVFFDMYGTMRSRFLCLLFVIAGTLMMTFTSPGGVPWLMIPGMFLMGVGGFVILLTNLQVANLFGRRRCTLLSVLVGAHESGSVVTLLMTVSYRSGINMQTSFMFLAISIVPLLVSTIALLPKIRIPWPLPANYGKKRGAQIDELSLKQQFAWKRENGKSSRDIEEDRSCLTVASQLFVLFCVAWYAVHTSLAVFVGNTIHENIVKMSKSEDLANDYTTYNAVIQYSGVLLSPILGVLMDRRASNMLPVNAAQMQNIAVAFSVTNIVSLLTAALSAVPVVPLQLCVLIMAIGVRVFSHSAIVAFLMHVNFPQEMFGRLYGLMMLLNSIVLASQYPIKLTLDSYLDSKPLIITVVHILLLILVMVHPANVWRHCKCGLLKDRSGFEMERRRQSSCSDASLVQRHLIQRRPTECRSNLLEVDTAMAAARRLSDIGLVSSGDSTVVIVIPSERRESTRALFEIDTNV